MSGHSDPIETFHLNDCVSCRSCSESCPSCRNSGIDPETTIAMILRDEDAEDIWKCLQCHRCTIMCPRDIDVAGMMLSLKEMHVRSGDVPQKILKSAESFEKDCKLSIPKGRMESLRKDLALPDAVVSEGTMNEIETILKRMGYHG